VQGVAADAAAETVPAVLSHMRRKAAAARRRRLMHRTRPTPLRAAARCRREADQVQHLRQRNLLTQEREINPRHQHTSSKRNREEEAVCGACYCPRKRFTSKASRLRHM